MSEKLVKLPKEVAEAVGKRLSLGHELRLIISDSLLTWEKVHPYAPISNYTLMNFNMLLAALVNGYEVEETPQDQVRALHEKAAKEEEIANYKKDRATAQFWSGYGIGVVDTVKALKLEIEDVNI